MDVRQRTDAMAWVITAVTASGCEINVRCEPPSKTVTWQRDTLKWRLSRIVAPLEVASVVTRGAYAGDGGQAA